MAEGASITTRFAGQLVSV